MGNLRGVTILLLDPVADGLEENQNKNNSLVSNFLDKLKISALFSVRNRWKKSAEKLKTL